MCSLQLFLMLSAWLGHRQGQAADVEPPVARRSSLSAKTEGDAYVYLLTVFGSERVGKVQTCHPCPTPAERRERFRQHRREDS